MRILRSLRQMQKQLLVALDFDHTIVDENTDIVVRNLLSNDQITEEVKNLRSADGWTAYMGKIFEILHESGFTQEQIQSAVCNIPVTPGFDKLLMCLNNHQCETIIISDSNSEFINGWLHYSNLKQTVNSVFTNPAKYGPDGCLYIDMYHIQDWCELSTKNLCKGHILETYIKEREEAGVKFSHTAYIGDGKNDLCPCLKLSEGDLAFPRIDFALMKMIYDHPVKAEIHPWSNGEEIIDIVSKLM